MRGIWKVLGDQAGSEVVEFGLVLLPLLAVLFLIMDVSWLFFAQASLQHAAGVGVRYAITNNNLSQDSIKSVVQENAMGFLAGDSGLNKITVSYYSPANPSKPLKGSGSTAGGNIIEISVQGVTVNPLGVFWPSGPTAISLAASSTDILESAPPPSS